MELTKEYLDKVVKSLASADALAKTNATLEQTNETLAKTNATLEQTSKTVTNTAILVANLVEDMREVKADLKTVKKTVDGHTSTLDGITKNTSDWRVEMAAMRGRMERYETALRTIALKLDVDLKTLLN